MKEIKLTQGRVTQVDDEWYEYLSQWDWVASYDPSVKGYYATRQQGTLLGQKTIKMHRVIMNAPIGMLVDHRDHDTLNNQVYNLRLATKAQNNRNSRKRIDNISGYKGVHPCRNKWRAMITFEGKLIHLGYFNDIESAARAYDQAARKYHGEFALLNFP